MMMMGMVVMCNDDVGGGCNDDGNWGDVVMWVGVYDNVGWGMW